MWALTMDKSHTWHLLPICPKEAGQAGSLQNVQGLLNVRSPFFTKLVEPVIPIKEVADRV